MGVYKVPSAGQPAPGDTSGTVPYQGLSGPKPYNPDDPGSVFETEAWLPRNLPNIGQMVGSTIGAITGATVGTGGGAVVGSSVPGPGTVVGAAGGALTGLGLGKEAGAALGRTTGQGLRDLYHTIAGDYHAPQSIGQEGSRLGSAAVEGALTEAFGGRVMPWGASMLGRGGLVLSGLSPAAAKTALEEGIIVAKGRTSAALKGALGKAASAVGGAKAAAQRAISAARGVAPDIAEQQASRNLSFGYTKLIEKQGDASNFVNGILTRADNSPSGSAGVDLRDVLAEAVNKALQKGPKGTPMAEADAVQQVASNYLKNDIQEWAGSVSNVRAHEIFQDQNQLARQVFSADNPRYTAAATRFHNALREVLRERLMQNAGPNMSVLDRAMRRQSALIQLSRELSGGEIEAGVERKFVRPAANQAARTIGNLAALTATTGGMATHNPVLSQAGLVGQAAMSHPAVTSQAAMLLNPALWQILGRYGVAPTMAGDIYEREQGR